MAGLVPRLLLVLGAVLLLGMGDLGGAPGGTVPETEENFRVRIVDLKENVIELQQFSMDGEVYLQGSKGGGTVTVPFGNIDRIEFGSIEGEAVPATVVVRSGERVRIDVKKRTLFYGSMGFGAYHVTARDLQRIEFL